MKGLWCVIGKAGIDESFAEDLINIINEQTFNTEGGNQSLDERLSDFLFFENGFMLSRWERAEVIRLIKGKAQSDQLKGLRELLANNPAPVWASENFFALLGLVYLDNKLTAKIARMTKNFGRDLTVLLSSFRLSDVEIRWLRNLFKMKGSFTAFANIHDHFWTQPGLIKSSCIWSFTHDPKYDHWPPSRLRPSSEPGTPEFQVPQ
jgi:hypothetical protein